MSGKFQMEPPPVVSIGITLEDDGWWLYCPECEVAMGPYPVRGTASRIRGTHLVQVHGGPNHAAGNNNQGRARRLNRRRASS